ncbi:MAG: nucleotide exchange factor GrpE [Actinomycetota bacterium]|mgnify:CR=1 FL=1|jgi:molecular chaperone GrpE|nr:MAG: grpE [Acidimicrobiaceae bacterium]
MSDPHLAADPAEGELDDTPEGDVDAARTAADAVEEAEELVEHDVEALLAERDSFKDIALRLQADFENYRKRVAAQQADEVDRATGKITESILPVLDACEAAFAHGVEGVEPIWSSLIGVLQKHGLEALDIADQPFDPGVAEAVLHEPGDGGEAVVAEVLRTGYRWKGRVLRPAMVKVRG